MASDNTAGQAGTRTADAAQTTQQMAPVPPAPKTSGANRTAAPSTGGASAAETSAASSAATPANGAPASGSAVKDGAVKAAAAALAAARNAAKKVQSTASGSSTGAEPPDAASAGSQSAPPAPASTTQSAPRPEMHYSAGGVHGGAQAETAPAGGGAQYAAATGSQPGTRPVAAPAEGVGSPRRVRLAVSRIDPWSIMKLAFLLSVAIGIMIVVATAVVWYSLNSLGTFSTIQLFLVETMGPQTVNITQFVELERMLSLSTLIALVNMVLFTAIATIIAILYNITAALVGGVHLTLTDD
ncbi:DUF3566 domain-containing protein [Isoptericola croceus]|uniref:DUF3566 domain-containing protein n=1 Tax=Isoptericola croceus TaxID=3031406 RepID=UPI0023F87171|nr:DUF3566 domain-containing protein [Isoptericola croceus]